MDSIVDYREQLINDGYHYYDNDIDRGVIEDKPTVCDECGGAMTYEGWRNSSTYIALAVCPMCGHYFEF